MSETTIKPENNPKDPAFAGPCPRCGGGVPNDFVAGTYPGALSRADNETYICSSCGQEEAMFQFLNRDIDLPALTEALTATSPISEEN